MSSSFLQFSLMFAVCKQMAYQTLQKNIQNVLTQESLKYKVTYTSWC